MNVCVPHCFPVQKQPNFRLNLEPNTMENPEEILHSLEEFSKTKPKDIPKELEEYLCFVAKTGDPVYQWSAVKSLFREKTLNVITDFYETCPSAIPPCPNVDIFNYDIMKNFILEKLEAFGSAPFTLQRICELLTTPRKEYNRIDKYMRALEKNILVVSTTEPGGRRSTENGDSVVNGLETEHLGPETSNSSTDINVEEMDDSPSWPRILHTEPESETFPNSEPASSDTPRSLSPDIPMIRDNSVCDTSPDVMVPEESVSASNIMEAASSSQEPQELQETVITCRNPEPEQQLYVSIEPVPSNSCIKETPEEPEDEEEEDDVSVTITAVPAGVQKRRNSVEPVVSSDSEAAEKVISEDLEIVDSTEVPDTSVPETPAEEPSPEAISEVSEVLEEQTSEVEEGLGSVETSQEPEQSPDESSPTEEDPIPEITPQESHLDLMDKGNEAIAVPTEEIATGPLSDLATVEVEEAVVSSNEDIIAQEVSESVVILVDKVVTSSKEDEEEEISASSSTNDIEENVAMEVDEDLPVAPEIDDEVNKLATEDTPGEPNSPQDS